MISGSASKIALLRLAKSMLLSQVRPIRKKNKDRNRNYLGKMAHDLSKMKYYNCNKKSHYLNNCIEPSKNQF